MPRTFFTGLGFLAGLVLGHQLSAHAKPPTCLDKMVWTGDEAAVAATRAALADGLLGQAPATACRDVRIEVHRAEQGFRFGLRHGARTVEHTSRDLVATTSWIESWLAPSVPAPRAADKEVPPFAPPGPRRKLPEVPPRPPIPLQLAVRALVDLDRLGPAWPGAALAAAVALSRAFWVGVAGAGSWAPERDRTERRALRISARGGWLKSLSWGALRLGGGVGVVSASARQDTGDGDELSDDDAGPFLEALGLLDINLSERWVFSLGAGVRVLLPDDLGSTKPKQPEQPAGAPPEPTPLRAVSTMLQLGVAWHNGWTR